jgi:hypothetical protein
MPVARLARASDLSSLHSLFDVSEVSAVAQPRKGSVSDRAIEVSRVKRHYR